MNLSPSPKVNMTERGQGGTFFHSKILGLAVMDGWTDGWRVRLLFLYFLPALPYYWLKCWVFLKDRSMQKLNAHSQNEADMSLWL